jgi:alpha-ribazole phosphatase
MKLTLIRHTSLQVPSGVCYGQSDIDVAASFLDEAAATKAKIAHMQFEAIYTSPLQRCVKLADALNFTQANQDDRLKELHFGDWEMQAWDDIPRDYFDVWAQDYANLAPPNGETFSQMQQRNIAFLDDIISSAPEANICALTHGGVIRSLLAHVLNMPLKGLFRFNVDYGSVTQIELTKDAVPKINFVNL